MYCNVCNCNLCDLHPRHTSSADCLVINNKNKNKETSSKLAIGTAQLKRRTRSQIFLE